MSAHAGTDATGPEAGLAAPARTRRRRWVLALVLLAALGAAAGALWVHAREQVRFAQATGSLSAQRALARDIRAATGDAERGAVDAFARLREARSGFAEALARLQALHRGDRWLDPGPPAPEALGELESAWKAAGGAIERTLADEEFVLALHADLARLESAVRRLAETSRRITEAAVAAEWSADRMHLADMQHLLVERILADVRGLQARGPDLAAVAERLDADNALLATVGKVHNGFLLGDASIGLERVGDGAVREQLVEAGERYRHAAGILQNLTYNARSLHQGRQAAPAALGQGPVEGLVAASGRAADRYAQAGARRLAYLQALAAGGGLAAALALVLGLRGGRGGRLSARDAARVEAAERRRHEAITHLQAEMERLAAGDLDGQAHALDGSTERLAGAFNTAVKALRERTDALRQASSEVGALLGVVRRRTGRLLEAGEDGASHLGTATGAANEAAAAAAGMPERVERCEDLAVRSADCAARAGRALRESLLALEDIRRALHEAGEPLARLGDTSQSLTELSGKLQSLSEDVGLVAMNASIRAARGGAGDAELTSATEEVQRLADRLGETAGRIEARVTALHADGEAAASALQSERTHLDAGVRASERAGTPLDELEELCATLTARLQGLGEVARSQAGRARESGRQLQSATELGLEVLQEARATRSTVDELAGHAAALQRAVNGFRVPIPLLEAPVQPRPQETAPWSGAGGDDADAELADAGEPDTGGAAERSPVHTDELQTDELEAEESLDDADRSEAGREPSRRDGKEDVKAGAG